MGVIMGDDDNPYLNMQNYQDNQNYLNQYLGGYDLGSGHDGLQNSLARFVTGLALCKTSVDKPNSSQKLSVSASRPETNIEWLNNRIKSISIKI